MALYRLEGKFLDAFKDKCIKAEKRFDNGDGVYICPVCDGTSSWCDDDYQSVECEDLERELLGDKYYDV
tara:strand:+ start:55 stop:261 length:207 start_codon:yes stop_codon:yes gene_type:complete